MSPPNLTNPLSRYIPRSASRPRGCKPLLLMVIGFIAAGASDVVAQCGGDKILPPLGAGAGFGTSLDAQGDDLIVGAPAVDTVVFYRWSNGSYGQVGPAVVVGAGESGGIGVALDSGMAFVGVPGRTVNGLAEAGAVLVYTSTSPGVWTPGPTLTAPTPTAGGDFGYSVDTDGTRLIVGQPGFANDEGRAHIYSIGPGPSFSLTKNLDHASIDAGARFGHSSAIAGVVAAVGAPFADISGYTNNGAAYPFRMNSFGAWKTFGGWSFGGSNLNNGWAIAASGSFVGFVEETGGWAILEFVGNSYELDAYSSLIFDKFTDISFSGNRACITSATESDNYAPVPKQGSFQIYEHDGTKFKYKLDERVYPLHTTALGLGESVQFDGNRLVLGAPLDDEAATDAGAIITYDATLSSWHIDEILSQNDSLTGLSSPKVRAEGTLCGGDAYYLRVDDAAASAPAVIIAGLSYVGLPFLGGKLGPSPDLLIFVQTDPSGKFDVMSNMPTVMPIGADIYIQAWVQDAGAPQGYSASSSIKLTTPY